MPGTTVGGLAPQPDGSILQLADQGEVLRYIGTTTLAGAPGGVLDPNFGGGAGFVLDPTIPQGGSAKAATEPNGRVTLANQVGSSVVSGHVELAVYMPSLGEFAYRPFGAGRTLSRRWARPGTRPAPCRATTTDRAATRSPCTTRMTPRWPTVRPTAGPT